MKYNSVIDYYQDKAHNLRDEAERIADDCFTHELQRLEQCCLNEDLKKHLKHFNRSIRGELLSVRLHISMIQFYLIDPKWWDLTHSETPNYHQVCHMIEAYDMNIKRGYLIGVFSHIEHCLRHFSRRINGSKTNREDFWKIRDSILNLMPEKKSQFYKSMLGLYANIRNTIHNDGLYYPKDGKDIILEYRENTYSFKAEQPIDFVEWELLLKITEDISSLLTELSKCNEILLVYNNN